MRACRWMQAASGVAGRSNVGLCPLSSFSCFSGFTDEKLFTAGLLSS